MVWSEGSAKRQTNQRSRRASQVGVLEMLRMLIIQNLYKEKQPSRALTKMTPQRTAQTTPHREKQDQNYPNPERNAAAQSEAQPSTLQSRHRKSKTTKRCSTSQNPASPNLRKSSHSRHRQTAKNAVCIYTLKK